MSPFERFVNALNTSPWLGLVIIGGILLCAGFLLDPTLDS